MFNIKFISESEGRDTEINVSCRRYDLIRGKERVRVSAYEKYTSENGVDFLVSAHPKDQRMCFITNEAGKTVDRIGPFERRG